MNLLRMHLSSNLPILTAFDEFHGGGPSHSTSEIPAGARPLSEWEREKSQTQLRPKRGGSLLSNDNIKNQIPAIKIHSGFIARVHIRCGKSNCRCTGGKRHLAHYHVTYSGGVRFRRYIRREFVAEARDACQAHRTLQAQLRAGRAEYKHTLARVREFSRRLRNE